MPHSHPQWQCLKVIIAASSMAMPQLYHRKLSSMAMPQLYHRGFLESHPQWQCLKVIIAASSMAMPHSHPQWQCLKVILNGNASTLSSRFPRKLSSTLSSRQCLKVIIAVSSKVILRVRAAIASLHPAAENYTKNTFEHRPNSAKTLSKQDSAYYSRATRPLLTKNNNAQ